MVIHLAARVHVMNDSDPANAALCEAVNVRATRTLLNASINAGVRRVVFLSTVKVLGEGTVDEPWTELHPENPQGSYAISKWTAERLLWEELSGTHTSAVVIRSPLVYGPGVGANFLRLMKLIQRGVPLPLAAVRNRRSMVSVWNLSDFIECAAFSDTAANQTYLISDGTDVSTAELVILLARALERPPRLFRLPLPVLRALATSAGFGKEWRRLSESLVVDISKAKRQLAWRPAVTMEDGIRQTAQWYEAAAR